MDYLLNATAAGSISMYFASVKVLNLIINGLPSKHFPIHYIHIMSVCSFKPYYKWITF